LGAGELLKDSRPNLVAVKQAAKSQVHCFEWTFRRADASNYIIQAFFGDTQLQSTDEDLFEGFFKQA
jgi:hypothetical protein